MKLSNYKQYNVRLKTDISVGPFYQEDPWYEVQAIDVYDAAKSFGAKMDQYRKIQLSDSGPMRLEVWQKDTDLHVLVDLSAEIVVRYTCKDVE